MEQVDFDSGCLEQLFDSERNKNGRRFILELGLFFRACTFTFLKTLEFVISVCTNMKIIYKKMRGGYMTCIFQSFGSTFELKTSLGSILTGVL